MEMLSFAEKRRALPKMHLSISFSLEQDMHSRDLIAIVSASVSLGKY